MQTVIDQVPFYPGRAPIDAYGNGGFRFAGMSHRGSILCLPSGISAWSPLRLEDLSLQVFAKVLLERSEDRRREHDVADHSQPDQQNRARVQGSTVASSISITGMSSLIGYTR